MLLVERLKMLKINGDMFFDLENFIDMQGFDSVQDDIILAA